MINLTSTTLPAHVWDCPEPLPLPRASYAAGLVNSSLVLAGGSYWKNGVEKIRTKAVHIYDVADRRWREGCALPIPLAEAASSADGQHIYIVGGRTETGITNACLKGDNDRWLTLPNLPEPRTMGSLATANQRIYLLGGLTVADDWESATNQFHVLNAGRWSLLPQLHSRGIVTHSVVIWDETLYCFGGARMEEGKVENFREIHSFSIAQNRWLSVSYLPKPLRALSAATGPDAVYLFGGYSTMFEKTIYKFEPKTGATVEVGQLPAGIADCKFFYSAPWWVGAGGEPGPRERSSYTWQACVA